MFSQNKSLNFGQYVPNDEVLNKKIHGNPRYQHVKSTLDTGYNVRRRVDELREKQKNCHHKKDEVFNRIKFANFIELLIEASKVKLKADSEKDDNCENNLEGSKQVKTKPDGLANVIMGVGEIDLAKQRKKPACHALRLEKQYPYLLLDVREKDKFLQCHIKTAKHYPSALLARSIGYETEELKLYKNSSPEVIILYDDDESVAARVATTLVQRGYDNVFLLTGGLKYCNEVFPRKPMSTLCAKQPPDPSIHSSPTVQIKNVQTEFSQEDIDIIEQYMDFPRTDCSAERTHSYFSHTTAEKLSAHKLSATGLKPKANSITYRRDSNSSLKSIEQARIKICQSAMDNREKFIKKAPWK